MIELIQNRFFLEMRDFSDAGDVDGLERALAIYKQKDSKTAFDKKLHFLFDGFVAYELRKDYQNTPILYEEALRIRLESKVTEAYLDSYIYTYIAEYHIFLNQEREAEKAALSAKKFFAEANGIFAASEIDNPHMERYLQRLEYLVEYAFLGVYLVKGNTKKALRSARRVIALAEQAGDYPTIAVGLINQAMATLNYSGILKADRYLKDAEVILKFSKNKAIPAYIENLRNIIKIIKISRIPVYEGKRLIDYNAEEIIKILARTRRNTEEGVLDFKFAREHFWQETPGDMSKED
jgi:tetratricopeptide (TPR) repeat protein